MTHVIRHVCPIPGCQGGVNDQPWYHDQALPVLTDATSLAEVHRGAAQAASEAAQATREHMTTHFLPPEDQSTEGTPTIGNLHTADGQAAIRLAEHVESVVVITREGMCQIVGRDTTDNTWLAAALINSGVALLTGTHPPKLPLPDPETPAPATAWTTCPVLDDEGIAPCGKTLVDGDCPKHGRP